MKRRAQRKRYAGAGESCRDESAIPLKAVVDDQDRARLLALARYTVSELDALGIKHEEQLEMWRFYLEAPKVASARPGIQAGQTEEAGVEVAEVAATEGESDVEETEQR